MSSNVKYSITGSRFFDTAQRLIESSSARLASGTYVRRSHTRIFGFWALAGGVAPPRRSRAPRTSVRAGTGGVMGGAPLRAGSPEPLGDRSSEIDGDPPL